jgi:hypothetical protein
VEPPRARGPAAPGFAGFLPLHPPLIKVGSLHDNCSERGCIANELGFCSVDISSPFVPFHTQCEPFRCQRPRDILRRARGAQRVSALHRHLAANLIRQRGGINMKARAAGFVCLGGRGALSHPSVTTVTPGFHKESSLCKHFKGSLGREGRGKRHC